MRAGTLLVTIAVAHTALCLARVPHAVFWKRWVEIVEYRREGDLENLFRRAELSGAEHVRWLQEHTPKESAIVFATEAAGEVKGPLEFAAAALWPRPLVNAHLLAADATSAAGLPLARGTLPSGANGVLVLRGDRRTLTLEVRR